jgi:hypothetical protein
MGRRGGTPSTVAAALSVSWPKPEIVSAEQLRGAVEALDSPSIKTVRADDPADETMNWFRRRVAKFEESPEFTALNGGQ